MWTIIKDSDLDQFESEYPRLQDYERGYVLNHNEKTGLCFLPRHFATMFPSQLLKVQIDGGFKIHPIDIEFTGTLRDNQKPFIEAASITRNPNVTGIIQGYPGIGKTVIAAKLAADYKQKVLIILDNTKLYEQWVDSFIKFTSITEDQIGTIKASKFEVDKPVTIAMVQTLVSKVKRSLSESYIKIRDAGFGTVFIDECHKSSSAVMYSKSSLFFNTPNVIGLSATPYNQDIAKDLMHGVMKTVLHKSARYELIPDVYFVRYRSNLPVNIKNRISYMRDMLVRKACYDSAIKDSSKYLYVIKSLVAKLVSAKHQTFIVCSTVAQVQAIHDTLTQTGIVSDMLYSKSTDVNKDAEVIVATYGFAGAGFDMKTLSALIYASPYRGKKSTIQTIGRILRKCDTKQKTVVFDLVDDECPIVFKGYIKSKTKIINEEFGNCNFRELVVD